MVGGTVMQKVEGLSFLPTLTKEEVLKELEISRKQVENGLVQDFEEALDEICEELDI